MIEKNIEWEINTTMADFASLVELYGFSAMMDTLFSKLKQRRGRDLTEAEKAEMQTMWDNTTL